MPRKKKDPSAPKGKPGRKPRASSAAAPSTTSSAGPTPPVWPPNSAGAAAPAPTMKPAWTPVQAGQKLQEWYALQQRVVQEAKPLTDAELALRKELASYYQPDGHAEGTINIELGGGWSLKCVYGLDRKFDEQAMEAVFAQLPPEIQRTVIKWEPKVAVTGYKQLTADNQKLVDQCVVAKPKAPTLELVPPKAE